MGLGSGIRDPGPGKNSYWIPDLDVKKRRIPDPQNTAEKAAVVYLFAEAKVPVLES
jgi:hypothetical protein